jgi:hypothetical protein
METIHVPAPPKEAFDKHRRMSDLIKAQVGHFKHVEEKLSPAIREALPQHQIVTEDDAAQYIAAMTTILRSGSTISAVPAKRVSDIKRPIPIRSREQISLAAAADLPGPSSKREVAIAGKTSRPTLKSRGSSPKRKK